MIDVNEKIDSAAKRYAKTRDYKAREEVANLIQPLLTVIAQQFVRGKPLEADVVLSSANLGLLDALEKYRPDRGAKFVTFAKHRISGAMMDGVREEDINGRLSLSRDKRQSIATDSFFKEHGRQPTPEELTSLIDTTGEKPLPLVREVSIPATDSWRREFVIDTDPTSKAATNDAFDYLTRGLSRRERMIYKLHYRDGMQFPQIASIAGVSRTMVSKILKDVRGRLEPRASQLAESVGIG